MSGCVGFLVVVALVSAIIWFISNQVATKRLEEETRDAQYEARVAHIARLEAEHQQYLRAQAAIAQEVTSNNEASISLLEKLPRDIERVEQCLDDAQTCFTQRAFAPFWDSVEKAALTLGFFDERVGQIQRYSARYVDLSREYRGKLAPFSVSSHCAPKLRIAAESSKRMHEIVGAAQRDFQFSVIYEQRKTNQILVAGFKSLAQALERMTWQITASIDGLEATVEQMGLRLDGSLQEIRAETHNVASQIAAAREDVAGQSLERAEREKAALEMLDNIQRRRHPSLFHGGFTNPVASEE